MNKHIEHVFSSLSARKPTRETVSAALLDPRRRGFIGTSMRFLAGDSRAIPQFWFNRVPNFGDLLAPAITEFISGYPVRHAGNRVRRKLLGAGSIAQFAQPGDSLWGTGSVDEMGVDLSRCRVLAVRGPLTRQVCRGDIPEIFGDPALLLPLVHTPIGEKRYGIGLVPHYVEQDLIVTDDSSVNVIDVTNGDWRQSINEIASCDVVLSSSLHGIIVAEAYGIPAVWVSASNRVLGSGFKFRDYYAMTNRESSGPLDWGMGLAQLVEHADSPPEINVQPLLNSWPKDWTKSLES